MTATLIIAAFVFAVAGIVNGFRGDRYKRRCEELESELRNKMGCTTMDPTFEIARVLRAMGSGDVKSIDRMDWSDSVWFNIKVFRGRLGRQSAD